LDLTTPPPGMMIPKFGGPQVKMKQNINLTLIAILTIATLEAIALMKGIDGAAFGIVIAVIAGLAGYKIKPPAKPSA